MNVNGFKSHDLSVVYDEGLIGEDYWDYLVNICEPISFAFNLFVSPLIISDMYNFSEKY